MKTCMKRGKEATRVLCVHREVELEERHRAEWKWLCTVTCTKMSGQHSAHAWRGPNQNEGGEEEKFIASLPRLPHRWAERCHAVARGG